MKSVYELSTTGGLRSTASPRFPEIENVDGIRRWIRIVSPEARELQAVVSDLQLPDEASLWLRDDSISSHVVTHGLKLVMTLPIAAPGEERAVALRAACTPTTLITVEEQALPTIDRVVSERCTPTGSGSGLTLPGLLIEVIEAAASSAGPIYLSLRRKLEDLADAIESQPEEVRPEDLLAIRSKIARLTMLWDDQIHGFMELKRCHSIIPTTDGGHELLRDLLADAGRGLKLLAQMENRLRDLRQHQQQALQESTNRRLNMLAILSSIYMPATLIAGLYGMNFEYIPVTTLRYGYFIVMAFIAIVVLGHFYFFYRRGWFK